MDMKIIILNLIEAVILMIAVALSVSAVLAIAFGAPYYASGISLGVGLGIYTFLERSF